MKIAFCFDLDGTLTKEEILPQIAKHVDLWEEIDLLTKITMRGLITFEKSFRLRVKLLSTVPISTVKETVSKIRVDRHLQDFVRRNKGNCFIVTGNLDVWVNDFIKENYDCDYFSSVADWNDDELKGVSKIIEKKNAVEILRKDYDVIVTIGDGMNDCSMFEVGDIGISFGGVHDPVESLIKSSEYVCYDSLSLKNLLNSLLKHYSNEN